MPKRHHNNSFIVTPFPSMIPSQHMIPIPIVPIMNQGRQIIGNPSLIIREPGPIPFLLPSRFSPYPIRNNINLSFSNIDDNIINIGIIFINKKGILFIKNDYNEWGIPFGNKNIYENCEKACERIFRNETKVDLDQSKIISNDKHDRKHSNNTLTKIFIIRSTQNNFSSLIKFIPLIGVKQILKSESYDGVSKLVQNNISLFNNLIELTLEKLYSDDNDEIYNVDDRKLKRYINLIYRPHTSYEFDALISEFKTKQIINSRTPARVQFISDNYDLQEALNIIFKNSVNPDDRNIDSYKVKYVDSGLKP